MNWQELFKQGQELAAQVRVMTGADWQDWHYNMMRYKVSVLSALDHDKCSFYLVEMDYRFLTVNLAFRLATVEENMFPNVVVCWQECYKEWLGGLSL